MLGLQLFRKKQQPPRPRTQVVVYDLPPDGPDAQQGAAAVKGNQVAIWRPPVLLDPKGRTRPGVTKELVARYLVSTTAALAEADLGPVTVEWRAQEGRFVETAFTIHAWGQEVEVVHPIAPVSQDLADAWELYKAGVALKVRELHKGHQRFDQANATIRRATRNLERLRDDDVPHFSDAEYLFLQAAFQRGIVLSALVPVGEAEPEEVVGTAVDVSV
jgi:hypothetical protein